MKKIGTVIAHDIDTSKETKEEISVRGVILKDDKVLLTYSNVFMDYATPGGRLEGKESYEDTLKRELREEIGVVIHIIKRLGYIMEMRMENNVFVQKKNIYFLVKPILYQEPKRKQEEIDYEMTHLWITPDEAMNHNQSEMKRREKTPFDDVHPYTTLARENVILKYIKEHYL